jgi:hypothetical protein
MFDELQLRSLHALLDTIIPPDDFPGAVDAGVADYLLRQLSGDLAELLPSYQLWLSNLDAEAIAIHGPPFAKLSLRERTDLLENIEKGEVTTDWSIEAAPFFRQIVEHCGEGYYSDPGNGGNREGIVWQMIGFEVRG